MRPALKRFRAALPDWHITLVVGPWSQVIVADDESVDQVVTIPFPGFTRANHVPPWQPYRQLFDEADHMRADRPAAVVTVRDDHWWAALMARVAGTPVIIGADHSSMDGLLTDSVPLKCEHWVARDIEILDGAAQILGGEFQRQISSPASDPLIWNVTESDRVAGVELLKSVRIGGPFAAIHPGSGAPVKLWPADRWAQVADALAEDGLSVLLTGTEAEEPLIARIADATKSNPMSLVGKTTLRTLAAIFAQAAVVAGVDSGPMHLAVAVDAPTVHVYGPSDVAAYGPWGASGRHRVVTAGLSCPRCGDLSVSRLEGAGCMVAVASDTVIETIRELRLNRV